MPASRRRSTFAEIRADSLQHRKLVFCAGLDLDGPDVGSPGEKVEEDPRPPVVVVPHDRPGVHPPAHDRSGWKSGQDFPEDAAIVATLETGTEHLMRHSQRSLYCGGCRPAGPCPALNCGGCGRAGRVPAPWTVAGAGPQDLS